MVYTQATSYVPREYAADEVQQDRRRLNATLAAAFG